MDEQSKRGCVQDRAKVVGGQKHEVAYEAKKTAATKDEVRQTVKAVGNGRTKVEQQLAGSRKDPLGLSYGLSGVCIPVKLRTILLAGVVQLMTSSMCFAQVDAVAPEKVTGDITVKLNPGAPRPGEDSFVFRAFDLDSGRELNGDDASSDLRIIANTRDQSFAFVANTGTPPVSVGSGAPTHAMCQEAVRSASSSEVRAESAPTQHYCLVTGDHRLASVQVSSSRVIRRHNNPQMEFTIIYVVKYQLWRPARPKAKRTP